MNLSVPYNKEESGVKAFQGNWFNPFMYTVVKWPRILKHFGNIMPAKYLCVCNHFIIVCTKDLTNFEPMFPLSFVILLKLNP